MHSNSSSTLEGESAERKTSPVSYSRDPENFTPPTVDTDPPARLAQYLRDVVRMVQCPICSYPLQDPVTLPCGRSLCKPCLPQAHVRTNISYPATENRLQGLNCPFPDCAKDHALGDCSSDVALNKVITVLTTELRRWLDQANKPKILPQASAQDGWGTAAVASVQDDGKPRKLTPGGRLMAAYALVLQGELTYTSEVTSSPLTAGDYDDVDSIVLKDVKEATRTEMDCHVCYALYLDPVTTPCGHTFCRTCLQRVMDHARICPVCRRELSIQPVLYDKSCPSNQLLVKIATLFWSDLLEARRQALLADNLVTGRAEFDLPIFVCALAFPSMPTFLHVFEPRYRLMVRRVLEGDRCFGVTLHHNGSSAEYGTVLRIINVEFFPDGRSLIETIGTTRFRILRNDVCDGYMVAQTAKVNDISISEEEELEINETRNNVPHEGPAVTDPEGLSPETSWRPTTRAEVETMPTKDLMSFAVGFVMRMREQSVGWLTSRILHIYGDCPEDPARFPWWFANILPVREVEKYRLLSTTSVRERLKICCGWIVEWENRRW